MAKRQVGHKMNAEIEERTVIKFDPPVSTQRYMEVCKILSQDATVEKVVDFGCSNGQFFKHIKRIQHLRQFVGVDVSYGVLESAYRAALPLAWECIFKRDRTLNIQFFRGNVSDQDSRLAGFDAVTCIELIEHLNEKDLQAVPATIFNFIRPKVAVITTPNRDFNVVFPELQGKRHWDHKFEWSRAEFQQWCSKVVDQYPSYTVEYTGVGDAPSDKYQDIGHCSQIAVFKRSHQSTEDESQSSPPPPSFPYELEFQTIHVGKEV
uniref:Small RNA 2'-O-methyltransferase n=1 Tax=Amblyomma maculatum TaxID=34609 RepID=G3MS58_AMBMU